MHYALKFPNEPRHSQMPKFDTKEHLHWDYNIIPILKS